MHEILILGHRDPRFGAFETLTRGTEGSEADGALVPSHSSGHSKSPGAMLRAQGPKAPQPLAGHRQKQLKDKSETAIAGTL